MDGKNVKNLPYNTTQCNAFPKEHFDFVVVGTGTWYSILSPINISLMSHNSGTGISCNNVELEENLMIRWVGLVPWILFFSLDNNFNSVFVIQSFDCHFLCIVPE